MLAIIIQTSLDSQPLRPLNGKPLLLYILESLSQIKAPLRIFVSISKEGTDDPIANFCKEHEVELSRGDPENVASRFNDIGRFSGCDAIVKISDDCPLIDHRIVERAMKDYMRVHPDLITNISPKTFPEGQSVEVIKLSTLQKIYPFFANPKDLKEVTPFYYRNKTKYSVINFSYPNPCSHIKLSTKTDKDFKRCERILKSMDKEHWKYTIDEILKINHSSSSMRG